MNLDVFTIVQTVLAFALAKLTWDVTKRLVEKRRYPYRWTCPVCQFQIRTNVRETYEISKSSHNHSRLREYKQK